MSCMIKGKMRSGLLVSMFLGVFALQAAAISGGSDAETLKQNLARDNKIIRIEPDRQRLGALCHPRCEGRFLGEV